MMSRASTGTSGSTRLGCRPSSPSSMRVWLLSARSWPTAGPIGNRTQVTYVWPIPFSGCGSGFIEFVSRFSISSESGSGSRVLMTKNLKKLQLKFFFLNQKLQTDFFRDYWWSIGWRIEYRGKNVQLLKVFSFFTPSLRKFKPSIGGPLIHREGIQLVKNVPVR